MPQVLLTWRFTGVQGSYRAYGEMSLDGVDLLPAAGCFNARAVAGERVRCDALEATMAPPRQACPS